MRSACLRPGAPRAAAATRCAWRAHARAFAALHVHREVIWVRKHMVTPIRAEWRSLLVSEDGTPLTRYGFK